IDQIVYLARLHGITLGAAERNALTLLSHLELADRGYAPLKNLSRAEIARVDIAATLTTDPDIVVLDDAFAGLDAESLRLVMSLPRAHESSGVPVVLVTHDWEAEQTFVDAVIILRQSRVTASGRVKKPLGGPRDRIEADVAEAARSALESRQGISEVTADDSD